MSTASILTAPLGSAPSEGQGVRLNGEWHRTHLHPECARRLTPMPKGWLDAVRNKVLQALDRDEQAPLQSGESRICRGNPPMMLYKWTSENQGLLGMRDLTKPFRLEISYGGIFGVTPSQLYHAPLPIELKARVARVLEGSRRQFDFTRLELGNLPKAEFVRRLKEGKLQKVGQSWLPTHRLFPNTPKQMDEQQREKVLPRVENWLSEERSNPLHNGESRPLSDGTLAYKWMDDSGPRTGLVGFQPAGATYRMETDGQKAWVLHGRNLYETAASPAITAFFKESLMRTRNPYKKGKTGREVATGTAETQVMAEQPGARFIVGLDESGRSNLAGPLVAAAVLIDCHAIHSVFTSVRDSKGMEADERYLLSEQIQASLPHGIGEVSPAELNEMNLNEANKLAFERALESLARKREAGAPVDAILVDGSGIAPQGPHVRCLPRGEQSSLSIAAASVLAAECFEQRLEEMDVACPGYDFARSKALATYKPHYDTMVQKGPSPYHRLRFKPVQRALAEHLGLHGPSR